MRSLKTFEEFVSDISIFEDKTFNDYPVAARNNAKRALDWKEKYGDEVKGGTRVGWTRARQLAKGENLSLTTIKRMKAFFDRHQKNKEVAPEFKNTPWKDAGHVAWLLWGGDAAWEWATQKIKSLEKEN